MLGMGQTTTAPTGEGSGEQQQRQHGTCARNCMLDSTTTPEKYADTCRWIAMNGVITRYVPFAINPLCIHGLFGA